MENQLEIPAPGRSEFGDVPEFAEECQKLTNEILRLENIQRQAIQIAGECGSPGNLLEQCLIEAHEQKIRQCEKELDSLLEQCRRRPAVGGILAEYYDR